HARIDTLCDLPQLLRPRESESVDVVVQARLGDRFVFARLHPMDRAGPNLAHRVSEQRHADSEKAIQRRLDAIRSLVCDLERVIEEASLVQSKHGRTEL